MTYKKIKIVDTMSSEEVLDLLFDDMKFLQYRIDENKNKYKRLARLSRDNDNRIYYSPLNFQSNRGFHYILQFFKRGKDEKENDKLGVLYFAWYVWKRGVYAVVFSRIRKLNIYKYHYVLFTPHFIDRYRERFLKDMSISKIDAFYKYYIGNLKDTFIEMPSEKYPDNVWKFCNQGMILCSSQKNDNLEAKTFITYDMAGIDQKLLALEGQKAMMEMGFELNLPEEDFEDFNIDFFPES